MLTTQIEQRVFDEEYESELRRLERQIVEAKTRRAELQPAVREVGDEVVSLGEILELFNVPFCRRGWRSSRRGWTYSLLRGAWRISR